MNKRGFLIIGLAAFWAGSLIFGLGVGKAINHKTKLKPTPKPTPSISKSK